MGRRVVVVGAGVAGLAAAVRLGEHGAQVTVVDPAPVVGGLLTGLCVGGGAVERYYHHIFASDVVAQRWIEEMGLSNRLEFRPAGMGFYAGGRLLSFGTPLALLRFPLLGRADRVRLGLRIQSLAGTPAADSFEHLTAIEWLRRHASPAEMRVFWHPLLRAKFGPDADRVSMAWLWARFRARAGDATPLRRERLGYLRGGFQQLPERMAARACSLGAKLRLGSRVTALHVRSGAVRGVLLDDAGELDADAVVWTPALTHLDRLVPDLPAPVARACAATAYHAALVVVVELAGSVLPCYWVTIGDTALPFTVAVEHTRFIPASDYGGRTIVYLGRYARPDDPVLTRNDATLQQDFLEAAAGAFDSAFLAPLAVHVFRAPAAQPIVPPGWSTARPPLRSGVGGLVLANMAQIYPWDRGTNHSLALGEEAAQAVLTELGALPRHAARDIEAAP